MSFILLLPPDINHHFTVLEEVLDVAPEWRGFGGALRLIPISLNTIEKDHKSDSKACLDKVLFEYLNKSYDYGKHGNPSWRKIVEAISHRAGGNNNALALRIAEHHSMPILLL